MGPVLWDLIPVGLGVAVGLVVAIVSGSVAARLMVSASRRSTHRGPAEGAGRTKEDRHP